MGGVRCDMETSMVNPLTEIRLVVNVCVRLHKRFAIHTISAEKPNLPVDGSRYRLSERFFKNIDHCFR